MIKTLAQKRMALKAQEERKKAHIIQRVGGWRYFPANDTLLALGFKSKQEFISYCDNNQITLPHEWRIEANRPQNTLRYR